MNRTTLNNYDAYPKTIMAQSVLYNNMSHHYRRLYSAKPCVDTSLPKSYKLQKQNEKNLKTRCVANLYIEGKNVFKKPVAKSSLVSLVRSPYCEEVKQKDGVNCASFKPKILKTDVESKVRRLREYHPPRKKVTVKSNAAISVKELISDNMTKCDDSVNENDQYNIEYENDCDWLQPCQQQQDTRSSSKPSSSDSAYTEEGEGMWSGGESRDDSPQQIYPKNWSRQQRPDDRPYLKFVRAITDEVLRKGIYTNKALKKVFQEHIHKNKHKLDLQRMQAEVEKLQEDLGIPKDDNLNDLDYGLGCGEDLQYPIYKFNDYSEVIDSISQLHINSMTLKDDGSIKTEWLNNNNAGTWDNQDISDDIRLPLKIPVIDNDNDSSIGCEILSDSSENHNLLSAKKNLLER